MACIMPGKRSNWSMHFAPNTGQSWPKSCSIWTFLHAGPVIGPTHPKAQTLAGSCPALGMGGMRARRRARTAQVALAVDARHGAHGARAARVAAEIDHAVLGAALIHLALRHEPTHRLGQCQGV